MLHVYVHMSIQSRFYIIVWSAAGCGRGSSRSTPGKKPRRRVASVAQRRAANIRERRRMFNLNEAFDKLRRKVIVLILKTI